MSSPADGFETRGAAVLEEKSVASCALASLQGRVFLAWTGSDLRVNAMWSADGYRFGGKQTHRHRTYVMRSTGSVGTSSSSTTSVPLGPAIAAGAGGVYLGWTDSNHRLKVLSLDGNPDPVVVRQRSGVAPALGMLGQLVVLAWTGTDRRVNLAYGRAGAFGAAVPLPATSSLGPAVCGWGNDLAVAWTGTDRRLNVLASHAGAFGHPLTLGETSSGRPAVCALEDDLVVAWTGSDRRINLLSLRRGYGPSGATRLDATSSHSPAICAHLGGLVLAWTGTDRRLNVTRVLRTR
jgi:hypothetical protein